MFSKTEDLFCKTYICYKVSNMHMFCIKFSNRYLYWPNRGLIVPTNLDKTNFVILSRKGKGVWGNRYLPNGGSLLQIKTSVFIKQSLCICLILLFVFFIRLCLNPVAWSLKNREACRTLFLFLCRAGLYNWYWCFHLQESRELVSPEYRILFYLNALNFFCPLL